MLSPLALSAAVAAADTTSLIAGVFNPPRLAPDFSLRGSDGAELELRRYRGKVVLLAFGYTSCTEVCPITLSILAQARKKLAAAAEKVEQGGDEDGVERLLEAQVVAVAHDSALPSARRA